MYSKVRELVFCSPFPGSVVVKNNSSGFYQFSAQSCDQYGLFCNTLNLELSALSASTVFSSESSSDIRIALYSRMAQAGAATSSRIS